jgi:hypothetical protein
MSIWIVLGSHPLRDRTTADKLYLRHDSSIKEPISKAVDFSSTWVILLLFHVQACLFASDCTLCLAFSSSHYTYYHRLGGGLTICLNGVMVFKELTEDSPCPESGNDYCHGVNTLVLPTFPYSPRPRLGCSTNQPSSASVTTHDPVHSTVCLQLLHPILNTSILLQTLESKERARTILKIGQDAWNCLRPP